MLGTAFDGFTVLRPERDASGEMVGEYVDAGVHSRAAAGAARRPLRRADRHLPLQPRVRK